MPASSSSRTDPDLAVPRAEAVRSRRGLSEFVELPYRLHRGDPCFVPPLRGDCRRLLDRRRNPFFRYGEAELFTVRAGGRVAGRIAALHNPRHNAVHGALDGFFGLFECVDDTAVARALYDAAAEWLSARGLRTMLGPVGLTMNGECGLLVDGFRAPPRVMMPYNPPYYPALLRECGMAKAKDLWAFERKVEPLPERILRIADRALRAGSFTVRPLDPRDFDAEVARVKAVYDRAWEGHWGFTPMTDGETAALARGLRRIADPALMHVAEARGEPVAVLLALPDVNRALPVARGRLTRFGLPIGALRLARALRRVDHARLVLLGVVPEFRTRGVEAVLIRRLYEHATAAGYRTCEFGWTLEDNTLINKTIAATGAAHTKTYRIYRRDL